MLGLIYLDWIFSVLIVVVQGLAVLERLVIPASGRAELWIWERFLIGRDGAFWGVVGFQLFWVRGVFKIFFT